MPISSCGTPPSRNCRTTTAARCGRITTCRTGAGVIIATDRLSAFDRILTAVPLKGQVLTQTRALLVRADADICPNHVIDYPDPNVLVCRAARHHAGRGGGAGLPGGHDPHLDPDHVQGGPAGDVRPALPRRHAANQKLPQTIITPTSKAFDGGHDEALTPARDRRGRAADPGAMGRGLRPRPGAVRPRAGDGGRSAA